jgi:hypothetical protein
MPSQITEGLRPLAVPIGDLHPDPRNPRRGNVAAIAESLRRFGQRKPVVARRDGTVTAGNHLLAAAGELGWTELAAVYVDDNDTMATAYGLADNRTADLGTYDDATLAELLAELRDADADLLAATAWTDDDLEALLAGLTAPAPPADVDDLPNDVPAITQPGDVWLLGRHRLTCGDSDVLLTAVDPTTVNLVLADPPYGVGERTDRRSKGRGSPENSAMHDAHKIKPIDFAPIHGDDHPFDPGPLLVFKRLVLFGANYYAGRLPPSPSWIVWDKLDGLTTDQRAVGVDDNADAELAWTNLGGPARIIAHRWKGVVKASEHGQARQHPTQKPVALMARIMEWRTSPGELVLDPYAGSGPVLLAGELTGRAVHAIEISPHYCDVICRRWQAASGHRPVLEASGAAVDFTTGT